MAYLNLYAIIKVVFIGSIRMISDDNGRVGSRRREEIAQKAQQEVEDIARGVAERQTRGSVGINKGCYSTREENQETINRLIKKV